MTGFPSEAVREALARAGVLVDVRGAIPETLTDITDDSRRVERGSLFVAVRGTARDGHDFLESIADRAGAAIVEDASRTTLPAFVVSDARRAAPLAASAAYGNPGAELRLVGVTGTNGKTTTVGMLRHLLDGVAGRRAASIGTLGVLVGSEGVGQVGGGGLTTPGPIELQRVLRSLVESGVATVAMEVSSHSLHQRRVDGLTFETAVFTNLTRDHLDYHGTMRRRRPSSTTSRLTARP
jgi:UDP-N-acetylmuramoyl-L-alanyl-D-glutamate--2,6-diaminopimelate ligase